MSGCGAVVAVFSWGVYRCGDPTHDDIWTCDECKDGEPS